jgi:hypothetical protein
LNIFSLTNFNFCQGVEKRSERPSGKAEDEEKTEFTQGK